MTIHFSQGAAAHPDSEEQQQRLREAAEGLRMATNAAAQNAIKKKLVQRLEVRLGSQQEQESVGAMRSLNQRDVQESQCFIGGHTRGQVARDWSWKCLGVS